MRPGGLLIVDERNWEYFYRNREALLRNPFEAYVPPRAMYYGTSVRSVPTVIEDGGQPARIELLFYRDGHVTELETARADEHYIGEIEMFPIRDPSLPRMLRDAGFEIQRLYSDLTVSEQPDPNATFYTYVAQKAR